MKESAPWLLAISLLVNVTLSAVLYISKSNYFMKIVEAAESIQESQRGVQGAIIKFNAAVEIIENATLKADLTFKKIEVSIEKVRADIGRIEDVIRF